MAGITKKNVIPAFLVCPYKSKYQRGHLFKVLVFLLVPIPQQHLGVALYQHQKIVLYFNGYVWLLLDDAASLWTTLGDTNMKLTDTALRALKLTDKVQKLSDGGGLYLHVTPTGSRLWRMAYRFEGKQKLLSFGAYSTLSLRDARKLREETKEQLVKGLAPARKSARPRPLSSPRNAKSVTPLNRWRENGSPSTAPPSLPSTKSSCGVIWKTRCFLCWAASWWHIWSQRTFWPLCSQPNAWDTMKPRISSCACAGR